MSRHRVKKRPYTAKKSLTAFWTLRIRALLKLTRERFAKLLSGFGKRFPAAPVRKFASNHQKPQLRSPSRLAHTARGFKWRSRMFHIKNPRRVLFASGALAVIVIAVVLIVSLSGGKTEQTASNTGTEQTPAMIASVSLVMPVYDPVQLKEGITASAVSGVQQRLMDLGYMDADETDGVFGEETALAVNRFKRQQGLTDDGIVDEQTYSLLFSEEAQYYTLSSGARDTDEDTNIRELQQRLVELGYLGKSTGFFGTETVGAVKKFQKRNGLSEDGKIGQSTREKLYSDDVTANFYSTGEKSDVILKCQQRLKKLGYLTTEPDGTFGKDTRTAVKQFQQANGLIADGYIGPETKKTLMSSDAQAADALAVGARGSKVTKAQERLKKLGYIKKTTGYFGSDTDKAVRSFQKTNKLKIDGKVGTQTWNKLMSGSAKKAPKGGSGSGSGGSGGGGSGGSDPDVTGANVESFISVAESKLGSRYVRGGKGPNVFDCSGFVYWCLNKVGVKQSYMTSYTWRSCTKYEKIKSMSGLKRGDVIVYRGHVAICAGNGYMIDASSSNRKVVKRKYTGSSYWTSSFICGFRIF